ncbi:MAG: type II secretory pathway predicted ATPase ExeA/septal ring-binding cell division protein DamX [Desulforhopalus sp.]|jgi:type II secretory pathway predicted ATPase ExeA/septal ring-binding cell division protein DamX
MTETPLHTDGQTHSPFQEEIVLDNYYAAENSENVLRSINKAIVDGVAMIVLSGDEGSGKTMLCHKLDHDLQQSCQTLFFLRTVDSFEDVVRIVAIGLGLDPQKGGGTRNVEAVQEEITTTLIASGASLLLIFDEAENIYLATLERIRKMLDRIIGAGGRIHVLFSGRKTFLENCEQLSMCDFQNTKEFHVHLEPFSLEELPNYLVHCCSKLPDVDERAIFTPEVVQNIYHIGAGNFRMTNILAEEAIQKGGDNTSFMVLLENVKEGADEGEDSVGFVKRVKDYIEQYRAYLPHAGVGGGLVLIAFFFLFSGGDDVSGPEPQVNITSQTESPAASKQELDKVTVEPEPEVVAVHPEALEKPQAVEQAGVTLPNSEGATQVALVEKSVEEQSEFPAAIEEDRPVKTEVTKETPISEESHSIVPVKIVKKEKQYVEIVELLRSDVIKKRPGKLPKTTQVTIKEEVRKQKSRNEVREVIASNAHFTVEQLYKKRLMAGTSWYNNQKNNKYTVQLMVLTSETAEPNLKKMLQEDRYRQEAGNFYIFKKLSTSDTLFVFYGEYETIAQARLAQNSLPQFLRNHKPYAISIKGAMAKVRR